jgi:alpha-galactosidase
MNIQSILVLLTSPTIVLALNNGLGLTPPMGYNSWYDVMMNPSETHVKATVDAMVKNGLVAAGYTHLNLDDGIVETARDANGNLVPDKVGFPNGWLPVAEYIEANGMTFGIYTDRGTLTCGGRAGASGHEQQDAAFYVANKVSYVKEDSCNAPTDHQTAYLEYSLMRDALNQTGKPIVFSLCGWVCKHLVIPFFFFFIYT